ncbi:MAG: S8 family serine peptidase [Chloroflexaceae bacterium]|nr:S8 family serine peptidase [Chloroflexaceae bacterium]
MPGVNDSSHGTHVGTIAAGNANTTASIAGISQSISGVAPRAHLMNYKVFYANDSIFGGAFTTELVAAIDDAVSDGANVINNSWGGLADIDPLFDPIVIAAEGALAAGVTVVFATGNEGPDRGTAGSPGYSDDFIAVGAVSTAQTLAAGFVDVVSPEGTPEELQVQPFAPADFGAQLTEVIGPLTYRPVLAINGSSLACEPLPNGALNGQIALIERGSCAFSLKAYHAQEAGAAAAIIYNSEEGGETLVQMGGSDRAEEVFITAVFVRRSMGLGMTDWYNTHNDAAMVQIDPQARVIDLTPDVVAAFSSRGPTFQGTIKPDVLAPGFNILAGGFAPGFGMDQHLGFGVSSGTSMAAPHVAGAAALLQQVHPDWSPINIKSALMSTANTDIWLDLERTEAAGVLDRGAGRIDLARAVDPVLMFDRPSLSYGTLPRSAGEAAQGSLAVTARNSSGQTQSYTVSGRPTDGGDFAIEVTPNEFTLAPGEAVLLNVIVQLPPDAPAGDYGGLIELNGAMPLHLPLWFRALVIEPAATVLLVDNDGSSSLGLHHYADYYVNALDALGISYGYVDVDALAVAGEDRTLPDIYQLQRYEVVLWFTGDNAVSLFEGEIPLPLNPTDQMTLIAYLQGGGNLIATGQDLTWASDINNVPPDDPRYGRSDLYHSYLGARFVQDNVFADMDERDREVVGLNLPWLADITLDLSNPAVDGIPTGDQSGAGNQGSVDEIYVVDADPRNPDEHTTPIFQARTGSAIEQGFVALSRSDDPTLEQPGKALPYRSTYLAFGLEGVRSDSSDLSQRALLERLIRWHQDQVSVQLIGPTSVNADNLSAEYTAQPQSSTGAEFVRYRWDFGDGTEIIETSEPTVVHTFAGPGNYRVRVQATNTWGHSAVSDGTAQPASVHSPAAAVQNPAFTFAETGQTLEGRFYQFWQQHGGLPVFGYPLTPQHTRDHQANGQMMQQFERARFEYHPQNAAPYDVLLGHLGTEALQAQGVDWRTFSTVDHAPDGCLFFAETGHSLCGAFQSYWQSHGLEFDGQPGSSFAESLALFGLPLSEPHQALAEDGSLLTVQWFERARFEYHPNNAEPYQVLLTRWAPNEALERWSVGALKRRADLQGTETPLALLGRGAGGEGLRAHTPLALLGRGARGEGLRAQSALCLIRRLWHTC